MFIQLDNPKMKTPQIRNMKTNISFLICCYLVTTTLFSCFYYHQFKENPDSFIVNNQLNQFPIHDIYQYLYKSHDYKPSTMVKDLTELKNTSSKLILNAKNNDKEIKKIKLSLKDLRQQQEKLAAESDALAFKKAAEYTSKKVSDLIALSAEYGKQLTSLKQKMNYVPDSTDSFLKLSELALQLSKVNLQKAKEQYKASTYIAENPSSFYDTKIALKLTGINKSIQEAEKEEISLRETSVQLTTLMHEQMVEMRKNRSNLLGWADFFYYSVGISTTTTFGDIMANNQTVRIVVSIQLIISLLLLGYIINSISHRSAH